MIFCTWSLRSCSDSEECWLSADEFDGSEDEDDDDEQHRIGDTIDGDNDVKGNQLRPSKVWRANRILQPAMLAAIVCIYDQFVFSFNSIYFYINQLFMPHPPRQRSDLRELWCCECAGRRAVGVWRWPAASRARPTCPSRRLRWIIRIFGNYVKRCWI